MKQLIRTATLFAEQHPLGEFGTVFRQCGITVVSAYDVPFDIEDADADPVVAETPVEENGKRYCQYSQ